MDQGQQPQPPAPNLQDPSSEPVAPVSETPKPISESLGNDSEGVRKEQVEPSEKHNEFPKQKERRPDHNTTVRTAAKTLEAAGYPITERTIINWCRPTKDGAAQLDCAFDDKEKKYFITRESLEKVMVDLPKANPPQPLPNFPKEVQKNAERSSEFPNEEKENSEGAPKVSEAQAKFSETPPLNESSEDELRQLRRKVVEQEYTIAGQDKMVEQLQTGMDKLVDSFTRRLTETSETVGELKSEVKQLQGLLGSGDPSQSPQERREQPAEENGSN